MAKKARKQDTDGQIEARAAALIYCLTQMPVPVTDRQKILGKALFAFVVTRPRRDEVRWRTPASAPGKGDEK
jgi:hypothetical protein